MIKITSVVYGYSSNNIWGDGARWCYRKERDRMWRQSLDRKWRPSCDRKSRVRSWAWPELCSACARKCIPALFSYYSSSTVVQVPWLPEVAEGHVTPSGFPLVCACATGSWEMSTLVGPFDRKWHYEASPRSDRRGWKGCAHAQPLIAQRTLLYYENQ